MELSQLGKQSSPLPWIVGGVAGLMVLLAGSTYWALRSPVPAEEIENLTVTAVRETLNVEITASGTIEPVKSVNISPDAPGKLIQLLVEQGQVVQEGQPLALMKSDEVRTQGAEAEALVQEAIANFEEAQVRLEGNIRQAQTRLAQAQASLAEAEARIPRDIEQAQLQLEAVRARWNLAGQRIGRLRFLVEEGAEAQDRLDEANSEMKDAQATLVEAQTRITQLEQTAGPEIGRLQAAVAEADTAFQQAQGTAEREIKARGASVQAAQARVEQLKVQFQDTVVRAPFSGIVTQKFATEGAFVTPTTSASATASATSASILALAQGLEVIAKVPEVDIGQLQIGQPVRIRADAFPGQTFAGEVVRIAPEAIVDQNVTSFEVTVGLLEGQGFLRSKMNVDVVFVGEQLTSALVIPTVAIVTENGERGVLVPSEVNGEPDFVPLTLGLTLDDKTEVLSGINSGDRVFIDLPEKFRKKEGSLMP
ncbi:MAG: efflux RND transporter periplasmic adaptor subunit [Cyanobacteria bacterium P01_H01_bin.15]